MNIMYLTYLPEVRPEFSICGLEVLGLDPELDPLQMGFSVFLNLNFLKTGFNVLVSDGLQHAPNIGSAWK
jgi:hypothetical protein